MCFVNTLVISGFGTNSHKETAYTAYLAGSDKVDILHFADVVAKNINLNDYQFLIFPGGFLDGDDLGAAQTAAIRWKFLKNKSGEQLIEKLKAFIDGDGLILGICNGFQLLVKLGLLPGLNCDTCARAISLAPNSFAKFEDRWVSIKANPASNCVFTKNLPLLKMPVRHGEGRVVVNSQAILHQLEIQNLIALQYINPDNGKATQQYPFNPNGSNLAIAGLSDPTGRILGLMPHPEAFHYFANHPSWTREDRDAPGTLLFANAIRFIRESHK